MDEPRQMLLTDLVSYWKKYQAMMKELWSHCETAKDKEKKQMKEAWMFRGQIITRGMERLI